MTSRICPLLTLLLAACAPSTPDPQEPADAASEVAPAEIADLSAWMSGFHRSPEPERVVEAIREMDRLGIWESAPSICESFLAEVFRLYPDRVADWCRASGDASEAASRGLFQAVLWSGVPDAEAILAEMAVLDERELKEVTEAYSRNPRRLLKIPVTRPEQLDQLWITYFANGDEAYVARIASVLEGAEADEAGLGREAVTERLVALKESGATEEEWFAVRVRDAARWSLRSNSMQHEEVYEILVALRGRAEGMLRAELEVLLDGVRASAGDG